MEHSENGTKQRSKKLHSTAHKDVIPDYEYLFAETTTKKGKKKNGFLRELLRMNFWSLLFSSFLYVLQAAPTWLMPLVTADIIDTVTAAVEGEILANAAIRRVVIAASILGVSILQNVLSTTARARMVCSMQRKTGAGIKSCVVRKLQSLSITYAKDMETGKIQAKFLRDTEQVEALLGVFLHTIIPSVISAGVACGIAISQNGIVSLFFLLVIPCNVLLSRFFSRNIGKNYRELRIHNENMSSRLTSMLEMMTVTKAHGLENTEIKSVNKSISKVKKAGVKVDTAVAFFGSWVWVLNTFLQASCVVFCSFLALKGKISVGDIVLFQSMFSMISGYVSTLVNVMPSLHSGLDALSSVFELMNISDVEMNIGKRHVPNLKGAVKFENVYYKYPDGDDYIIKDFSLDVKPGECIAVVGSSGSGKSTLMNMIIGFLLPVQGTVSVDGKSLADCNLSEYRHHISVVPQSSILFAGSIRDNITYGLSHYTEEQLWKAVEIADLQGVIDSLPDGIDSDIGEHGDKLSGGQKQRITIARALIRDPAILIFDEATSALDNISEYHVQKAIASSIQGRTTFIVAHRLSTIRGADRILVMEHGECVESGTYEELMEKQGRFYELKNLNDMNAKIAEEALS